MAKTDCASRYESDPVKRETWPTDDWKISTLEEHCLDREKVEKAVWYFEQNYSTSSLLIIRHGELVYEKYFFRFNKPERRVPIYSITKSFLSALVGIAIDQGQIDSLDHTVSEYFPEYFYPTTDQRMRKVTLRDLLTMSAGFIWLEDGEIEERWQESGNLVEASINLKFQDSPGEYFNYSSAHTQLLSAILTEIVSVPLREYAQSHLFSPLGIQPKDWNWGVDDQGYYLGGWGMNLRPRDIARFGYLYLNDGYWDGQQLVSSDWVRQSTSAQIDTGFGLDYGYLWWIHRGEDQPIFEGRGYGGQSLYVIPNLDMIVVVTANVNSGNVSGAPDPAPIIYDWIVKAVTDK
jgi:CubicO group peptidase (beta-lactamase class C family)